MAAGLFIALGTILALALQSGRHAPPAPRTTARVELPNLLDALDPPQATWQSPTAFLLDLSNTSDATGTAPAPGQNGSETRHSNG